VRARDAVAVNLPFREGDFLSVDGSERKMEVDLMEVRKGDLHFPSWHNLIREVVGYYDRSKFKGGNNNLVEYC